MLKKSFFVFVLLCTLVATAGAAAQAGRGGAEGKRAFTIEDLYRVKAIGDVHIAPDGRSIVYSVTTSDLARGKRSTHLWLMNADGSEARQITSSDKSESGAVFSPDGKWIAFVSARGGESDNVWVISTSGGEGRQVTQISTSVGELVWSPDGKAIAFSSDVYPECSAPGGAMANGKGQTANASGAGPTPAQGGIEWATRGSFIDDECNKTVAERWEKGKLHAHMADALLYRHWTDWRDGKRTHILLAEVASGAVRDLTPGEFDAPRFQLGGPTQYAFSPDGRELCYESQHDPHPESSTNDDLWLLDLTRPGAQPRNITAANKAYDGSPKYSPDGRWIAYRLQKQPGYESDLFRLAIYDRQQGTSKVLTESFRNWVDDMQWAPDSRALYFTGPVEGNDPIFRVDLNGSWHEILRDAAIGAFEVSKQGDRIVYTRTRIGEPVEIYGGELASAAEAVPRQNEGGAESGAAVPHGSGAAHRLTHLNEQFAAEVDVRPGEAIWVDGARNHKQECFVVKPHGFVEGKKYPLIMNVHGGPQSQWADSFRGDWQVYPGAGYVVAFCNPHGSTGYGQEYTAEISGDYGGAVMQDIAMASDALAKLPYVDAERMGVMGWSWGGYAMDWIAGHNTRFKAIASMMGIYDLTSFYGATEELWFPTWDFQGTPWDSQDYTKFAPVNFANNFKTPTLIISGERDYRVPYTQSLEFFTALQKRDVPSRLIIFSDAGHWPSWYEMALYYTAHLEWFQKYLGGGGPPWTTEAFLRNEVFNASTGGRYKEAPRAAGETAAPRTPQGKPGEEPPATPSAAPEQKPPAAGETAAPPKTQKPPENEAPKNPQGKPDQKPPA